MKTITLYILLLSLASGTGYELWTQHETITFLEGSVSTLNGNQQRSAAKLKDLEKVLHILNKNQATLNDNQKNLAKAVEEIINALSASAKPSSFPESSKL